MSSNGASLTYADKMIESLPAASFLRKLSTPSDCRNEELMVPGTGFGRPDRHKCYCSSLGNDWNVYKHFGQAAEASVLWTITSKKATVDDMRVLLSR